MSRRKPRQLLVILLVGSLMILAVGTAESRAGEFPCGSPPYISAFADTHYHPTIMIVYYERNADASSAIHDVVALVTPEKGLGVSPAGPALVQNDGPAQYRAIHVHDDSGALHVEQDGTRGYRLCDFFELWRDVPRSRDTVDGIVASRMVHVKIGDRYLKNVSVEEMLRVPLNHDLPVIIFVEKKRPL